MLSRLPIGSGAPRELLIPVLGVDRSYLDTGFQAVRDEYGTMERYVTEGLGMTGAEQQQLRDRLLE